MTPPRRRVVLLGPDAKRYRGGIAQFTSRLAQELDSSSELQFVSWSELYPRFLIARETATPSNISAPEPLRPLSFSRPWSWWKTAKTIAAFNPEQIIFTWSHPVHAPVYYPLLKLLRRRTGAERIGICHNVLPHERFPLARPATAFCLSLCNRAVVHSSSETSELKRLCPALPCTTAFLPPFDFFGLSSAQTLPRDFPRLLFFGAIRPYKGLEVLLQAMPILKRAYPGITLRIAGEIFYGASKYRPLDLICALGIEDCIEKDIRYIPDAEMPQVFSGVDAVVFPFQTASQSASLSLALAMGLPAVCTRVGGFPDVIVPGKNGALVEPGNPAALAAGILDVLRNPPQKIHGPGSWEDYVALLLNEAPTDAREAAYG